MWFNKRLDDAIQAAESNVDYYKSNNSANRKS